MAGNLKIVSKLRAVSEKNEITRRNCVRYLVGNRRLKWRSNGDKCIAHL